MYTQVPEYLDEEGNHKRYSREVWEEDYKQNVYYRQRKGGESWFRGRVSKKYKDNYDRIFKGGNNGKS
jgi:hypothetical protein